MTSTFKSRKSNWLRFGLAYSILHLVSFLLRDYFFLEQPRFSLWFHAINIMAIMVMIWFWFSTSYRIQTDYIYYKWAFFKGKIEIASIKEIEMDKSQWSGRKTALASKGMIIKYNEGDDIYISPNSNKTFVEALLKINDKIQVNWAR